MFRQTHIRLTVLNSLVFIILISILGGIIYFYTESQLYRDVNQSLKQTMNYFENQSFSAAQIPQQPKSGQGGSSFSPRLFRRDPRIFVLLWDKNNHLAAEQNRESEVFIGNEKLIRPSKMNKLEDVQVDQFSFRYIAGKVDTPFGQVTVQVLRNVNSEEDLLNRLLVIILIGCGIGILCAVGTGYFLAGRSLIPIKKAWEKQQQFVSDASHELRTPLAVIQAKTDLLFRSPSATIKDKILDISTISTESRRLSKLVANLLTLARSDSDQIEMKKETFQLDALLRDLTQHYEEIISYQGKSIHLEAPESVKFFADKERIHQLIVILLDNAMKYTNEGGQIWLCCSQTASSIVLRVRDNGIGITEADIPKIFDRFYQSDKARTGGEGMGLGLSIAKWIIDKHHGKVRVESRLGEGTMIEVIFPKVQKA